MSGRAERNMIAVEPEAHLVARLDAQLVAQVLRDDDLSLRTDALSHTGQYGRRVKAQAAGRDR